MRRRSRNLPLLLIAAGAALLIGTVVAALVLTPRRERASPPSTTRSTATTTTAAAPPATTGATTTSVATTAAPAPVAFSWQRAGGLVVHADSIDPAVLGDAMRAAGFGWIAVQVADGSTELPLPPGWIDRFRAASGLPVGGWSVLRTDPAGDARLAASLVQQDGLDFYVADAELEYAYTNGEDRSTARLARSREFVSAFRAVEPSLPAALSSYCRPDMNDLDWAAWARAGFDFLPQAYVEDLGPEGDPGACVRAASRWFPRVRVHPTLGVHPGLLGAPSPAAYGALLAQAGTLGFSVYPAENVDDRWPGFAAVIRAGAAAPA